MNKEKKIKCPHCKKNLDYYTSKHRPFCSERCKMIDLGHWLDESYAVPGKENNNKDKIKDE